MKTKHTKLSLLIICFTAMPLVSSALSPLPPATTSETVLAMLNILFVILLPLAALAAAYLTLPFLRKQSPVFRPHKLYLAILVWLCLFIFIIASGLAIFEKSHVRETFNEATIRI